MTREEDLIRIAKKLDKMVSRNNTEGALDLLRELQKFNMTLKLLQDTRIGMSVNGIRKHCRDEDVVSLAKILIKNWKRLLDSSHSQKAERPNEMKNGSGASTQSPSGPSPDTESRRDSSDFSPQPPKKPINDAKKERKDSTDTKSGQRQQSSDSKPQRRDSGNSKSVSSPLSKKLLEERRESHGPKLTLPGAIQRKVSTDSNDGRKSKPETPKTPSTPTTPLSPSFSPAGGPLSPHLLTGDSVRDKCIEMLSAALRTDDDYKYYGANCDAMAAEIEDHIL
ncbi:hypothetical protein PDJAM_G00000590 [Pangasius djambal]|uniref:Uncharacterized protein n=1 Tax=Pangasius djambal TaxID=1691987 RepID=A0ACC5XXA0_9TELE|nr:hypothetical protein [Pangasius djambal]